MNVPPKNESEASLSRKVELGTLLVGLGIAAAALVGLAVTKAELRPIGFLSTAGLGLVVAVIGALQLRKIPR